MSDIRIFILRPNKPSREIGDFMKWEVERAIRRHEHRLLRPVVWYDWVIMGYWHQSTGGRNHLTVRGFVGGWARYTLHVYSWNGSIFYDNGGSWEREGWSLDVAEDALEL
ncbi:hypothetical protein BD779DRAFT_1684830 [Infundibulicybe gibba]|nr:hypothetical protein BD779DRAFT_1684830 [Infundibulicybe gibba]